MKWNLDFNHFIQTNITIRVWVVASCKLHVFYLINTIKQWKHYLIKFVIYFWIKRKKKKKKKSNKGSCKNQQVITLNQQAFFCPPCAIEIKPNPPKNKRKKKCDCYRNVIFLIINLIHFWLAFNSIWAKPTTQSRYLNHSVKKNE